MSTQLDFLRALLFAHYRGDEGAFRSSVWEIIENERRVNRTVTASELERILNEAIQAAQPRRNGAGSLHGLNGAAGSPKDKDKNAQLLEIVEARQELDELVLSPETRNSLDRVIAEWRKADLLKAHGLRPVSKLLFYGPPGCGKSVAAEALAKALFLPLATVKFDALVSSYLGCKRRPRCGSSAELMLRAVLRSIRGTEPFNRGGAPSPGGDRTWPDRSRLASAVSAG